MAGSVRTPIEQANCPEEVKKLLKGLWIDSLEEAIAYVAALPEDTEALRKSGLDCISAMDLVPNISGDRLTALRTPRNRYSLGCKINERSMEQFRLSGSLRESAAPPAGIFKAEIPKSVRLMDKMQPIRDQAERGTCVAFGSIALREFLAKDNEDLSEQFLYWACKELDGFPDDSGTFLHTAMAAFSEYGVCEEASWRYNPRQTSNEGQGPPPSNCCEKAKKYILNSIRSVEPGLVLNYKHVLAGSDGHDGMPVVIGTLVFDSWLRNEETFRTGKIIMPMPFETPVGGHAWCVVGYVDDSRVPGGGYFIIRNSWGNEWAPDSPEAPGHAMMPYAYLEKYADEAFTGSVDDKHAMLSSSSDELESCIQVLPADSSEELEGIAHRGALLLKGSKVLADRYDSDIFRADTPANRQRFKDRDFTWNNKSWQRAWFPKVSNNDKAISDKLEKARVANLMFSAAIEDNILDIKGKPFPNIRDKWWFYLLPFDWEPEVDEVMQDESLKDEVLREMVTYSGIPTELDLPDDWKKVFNQVNRIVVYKILHRSDHVHVVSVFLTPLKFTAGKRIDIQALQQDLMGVIKERYEEWKARNGATPLYTFFTFGSLDLPQATGRAMDRGSEWMMYSTTGSRGEWIVSNPGFGRRLSVKDFIDRLKPETELDRTTKIRSSVSEILDDGRTASVDSIKERTGYRKTQIKRAFLSIQQASSDEFRIINDKRIGQWRLERTASGSAGSQKVTKIPSERNFLQKHGIRILGVLITPLVNYGFRKIVGDNSSVTSLVGSSVIIYISNCIQSALNRRAGGDEDV